MARKCEAPAGETGATRNLLGGWLPVPTTLPTPATQLPALIAAHIGPEALAILALAAGGAANG